MITTTYRVICQNLARGKTDLANMGGVAPHPADGDPVCHVLPTYISQQKMKTKSRICHNA